MAPGADPGVGAAAGARPWWGVPTAAERQALLFLLGIALLGGGVRLLEVPGRGATPDPPSRAEAGAGGRAPAGDTAGLRRQRGAVAAARGGRGGRQPPGAPSRAGRPRRDSASALAHPPVDLNRAAEAELERLPRVGPALARRIVADRARHGPFPSLEALARVPGIGPATLRVLAPHVTFSPRPSPYGMEGRAPAPLPPP